MRYRTGSKVRSFALIAFVAITANALASSPSAESDSFVRPIGFPKPAGIDLDNWNQPLAELGRFLFFDKRLSINNSTSCASCHESSRAFTDGRATSIGATGEPGTRNAMSLVNLAYRASFGWSDEHTLAAQLDRPLFGKAPIEMGAAPTRVPLRISEDQTYQKKFADIFGANNAITWSNIKSALMAFELTLISGNSQYDQWIFQDVTPPKSVIAGMRLFFSDELGCSRCHGGIGFNSEFFIAGTEPKAQFQSNGLTRSRTKFRVPTLRNIEVTAPYMHDGRFSSLSEVIDFYARGPNKHLAFDEQATGVRELNGFHLNETQKNQLMSFLNSLTDESFINNPSFLEP